VIAHIKACFERIIPLLKMKFVIASFVMLFALASVEAGFGSPYSVERYASAGCKGNPISMDGYDTASSSPYCSRKRLGRCVRTAKGFARCTKV
jgi:hypothetical protein